MDILQNAQHIINTNMNIEKILIFLRLLNFINFTKLNVSRQLYVMSPLGTATLLLHCGALSCNKIPLLSHLLYVTVHKLLEGQSKPPSSAWSDAPGRTRAHAHRNILTL